MFRNRYWTWSHALNRNQDFSFLSYFWVYSFGWRVRSKLIENAWAVETGLEAWRRTIKGGGLGAIANQFTPYINYSITETTTEESLIRRRHRELDKVASLYIDKGLLLQVASFEQYKNDIFATDDIKTEHKNAYWLNVIKRNTFKNKLQR